jgi:hypothetical protein
MSDNEKTGGRKRLPWTSRQIRYRFYREMKDVDSIVDLQRWLVLMSLSVADEFRPDHDPEASGYFKVMVLAKVALLTELERWARRQKAREISDALELGISKEEVDAAAGRLRKTRSRRR